MFTPLHTMVRVTDLDRSIAFYEQVLGMTLFKKKDYPTGKFTLAFLGYNEDGYMLELTHNWETNSYTLGDAYGHLAFGVKDIYKICEDIKNKGGKVTREPSEMKFGGSIIAFIEDPDGYKIELIQR